MTVNGLNDKMNSGTGRGQDRGQLGVGAAAGPGGAGRKPALAPHVDDARGQGGAGGQRASLRRCWWGWEVFSL